MTRFEWQALPVWFGLGLVVGSLLVEWFTR